MSFAFQTMKFDVNESKEELGRIFSKLERISLQLLSSKIKLTRSEKEELEEVDFAEHLDECLSNLEDAISNLPTIE